MGFDKPQIKRCYKNLSDLFMTNITFKLTNHSIWTSVNFLECPTNQKSLAKQRLMIWKQYFKCRIRAERRHSDLCNKYQWAVYTPEFIYKGKRMKAELLNNTLTSANSTISDNNFINTDLFMHWLQHCKEQRISTQEQPDFLKLDIHSSHCTLTTVLSVSIDDLHLQILLPLAMLWEDSK